MSKRILIVEDEPAIRDMLVMAVSRADMQAIAAADVRAANLAIAHKIPDLILLDWMLPGTSGLEFARQLQRDNVTRSIPIIMLTARGEELDKVSCLDAGVDDYVVKPFSTRELIARINAVIRRAKGISETDTVESGSIRIDAASHRVFIGEQAVDIGPTEYRLLYFFATHAERAFSRAQILDHVWGGDAEIEERTVDVHIRRLRKLLEPFNLQDQVQTVHGVGYRYSIVG